MINNYNKYIRIFCCLYLIITVYCIWEITHTHDMYKGYGLLFYSFLITLYNIFVLCVSFVKRARVIHRIYGSLSIALLIFYLYLLIQAIVEGNNDYHNFLYVFLLVFIPISVSYVISFMLRKKNKEISFWALAFNFEILYFIISLITSI
jgi:hypothetical protein